MENFTFSNTTKIIFGRDTEMQVGQEVKQYSKKILLHYGGESAKKSGLLDRVKKSLDLAGVEYVELSGVKPNPRLSLVYEGIKICREKGLDFILAVGGGSVIDSAKGIGAGVVYNGDVWNLYTKGIKIEKTLPVGTVLTIPAAGSEASIGSVITNEDSWLKRDITTELIRPVFSIMNPELTTTLPAFQTACGATDIMAHIMERYFTNVDNVDFTDRLCEATLKTVIRNAQIVFAEPENYNARAEIMWAGTIAHNDLLGTGRIGDWASHNIEHEVSGIYDVAHGAGLAVIFPAWMKYVYKNNINRFVKFATRVWDVEPDFDNPERTAMEGIIKLEKFFREIGLETTLSGLDIGSDRFDEMAIKATNCNTKTLGSFMTLKQRDIVNILEMSK